MSRSRAVSTSVIKRLPRYYRFLGELRSNGLHRISSKELSERMGLTASQIRQDLNCFGEFGQQGYGYNIELLQIEIGKILGLNNVKKAILIGAGYMGRALVMHFDMNTKGFTLIGIFDKKQNSAVRTTRMLRYFAFRGAKPRRLQKHLWNLGSRASGTSATMICRWIFPMWSLKMCI